MRRKTGRRCSLNDLSGAHVGAQKTKKRGMLQVDEVASEGSWAILTQNFFKKEGFGAELYDFPQEEPPIVTAGLSTYAPPLNAPPQGFRASREARDIIRCVSRRGWSQIK